MDYDALLLSLRLACWTVAILLPLGVFIGHFLARSSFRFKPLIEATFALPLVLPPTVLGYYLLIAFGSRSPAGQLYEQLTGGPLVFTFGGLLVASVIFNLPFAIQPMQRSFETVSREVRDAAACCGLSRWRTLWRIELPLSWPGVLSALVLTFAHTLGEFGVVLMVGGNIPGETRTIAVSIYDRVQAFDHHGAAVMSATLLLICLVAIGATYFGGANAGRRHLG